MFILYIDFILLLYAFSSCDPTLQKAMEKVQKAISRHVVQKHSKKKKSVICVVYHMRIWLVASFRLQAESESWEALLNQHRSKAEELERWTPVLWEKFVAVLYCCCLVTCVINPSSIFFFRKLERGQEGGVSLDTACVSQSSQHLFIQNKPDYHNLLCRQQPMLHTIEMIVRLKWNSSLQVKIHKQTWLQY